MVDYPHEDLGKTAPAATCTCTGACYTFNQYDDETARTDKTLNPDEGVIRFMPAPVYYALKMNGEAGELAEKVGKLYRDKGGVWTEADKFAILKEIGDVLWYCSRLCVWMGFSLGRAALENVIKIKGRKERGTTHGDGDDR